MASRATRSDSRRSNDHSRCHLLTLSHDELGVIVDGLADPLQPVVAVALSSSCKGMRTPLRAALEVLQQQYEKVDALCRKMGINGAALYSNARIPGHLNWHSRNLTADDMATFGILLRKGQPFLRALYLTGNEIGDAGMQALCDGLSHLKTPSLEAVNLTTTQIGPAGAAALAPALCTEGMSKVTRLWIGQNDLSDEGVTALAAYLRQMPALEVLCLEDCMLGDEGLASLLANLGKDDFKALRHLYLNNNHLTEAAGKTIVSAVNGESLQSLKAVWMLSNDMSPEAEGALKVQLERVWKDYDDEDEADAEADEHYDEHYDEAEPY